VLYGLDDRWFESLLGLGIFLFATASRPALGPNQPPIQWIPGALSLGVKQPRREADHSPPYSDEVRNTWSYTSIRPIRLHGVALSEKKAQEQLWYRTHQIFSLLFNTSVAEFYNKLRIWSALEDQAETESSTSKTAVCNDRIPVYHLNLWRHNNCGLPVYSPWAWRELRARVKHVLRLKYSAFYRKVLWVSPTPKIMKWGKNKRFSLT
jgi:hypothetical protein